MYGMHVWISKHASPLSVVSVPGNDNSPTAGVSVIRVSGPESGSSLAALCSKRSKMPAERQVREQSHVTKLPLPLLIVL